MRSRPSTALAQAGDDLGALVGAGTVLSISAAKRAVDAGARFIVSPHTDAELIAWCALMACPASPGRCRHRRSSSAWSAGASAVKLFPAAAVGAAYLKQIAGPFPASRSCPPAASLPRPPATGSRPAPWPWAWAAGSSATASQLASPSGRGSSGGGLPLAERSPASPQAQAWPLLGTLDGGDRLLGGVGDGRPVLRGDERLLDHPRAADRRGFPDRAR